VVGFIGLQFSSNEILQSIVNANIHRPEGKSTIDFNFQQIVIYDMKSFNLGMEPKVMLRIDSSKLAPTKDYLNLTKIGSFLVQGKLSSPSFTERNISLNDESATDATNSSVFLAQAYSPINSTRANIFEQVEDSSKTYIGRVFSPFNVTRNDTRAFNKKYDFMVAISGSSTITPDEQS
jgi:hypothetical protein